MTIKCALCGEQTWSQPIGSMWRHDNSDCLLGASAVLGESDVAAINAAIEQARNEAIKIPDGANVVINTPPLPKSEVVKYLQNHILQLNKEIHRMRNPEFFREKIG